MLTDSGTLILSNNTIKNNVAGSIITGNGGGAYLFGNETVTMINNIIENNIAWDHCGGVAVWNVGYVTMENDLPPKN